jgi:uncharacterized phage-associated protein
MPFDSKAIANYFLKVAKEEEIPLTQMKLQKLVYYSHGWHLGIIGPPLLDEQVQAWSFGPVIRSLYNEFREFGATNIDRLAEAMEFTGKWTMTFRVPTLEDCPDKDSAFIKAFLSRIWNVYKNYSATQLTNMTHAEGTPWDTVRKSFPGAIPKYATIDDDIIRRYFQKRGKPE